jgi:L-histidine N-alpha-methyltransferase
MDIHLTANDLEQALERDVRQGLQAEQKWLPPVWFYDDKGSELFDEITRLPARVVGRRDRNPLVRRGVGRAGSRHL